MITCHECRNYIGLVCVECKGFDKFEVETDEAKQAMRKFMKYRGDLEYNEKLFKEKIQDVDNMVYTIKLDSFNTEVKDIERTVESLEKWKSLYMKEPIEKISHEGICNELSKLYYSKNADYGDSTVKVRKDWGDKSPFVRIADKYYRLVSLMNGTKQNIDESIEDTLLDLANYAIMEVMQRRIENEKVHG